MSDASAGGPGGGRRARRFRFETAPSDYFRNTATVCYRSPGRPTITALLVQHLEVEKPDRLPPPPLFIFSASYCWTFFFFFSSTFLSFPFPLSGFTEVLPTWCQPLAKFHFDCFVTPNLMNNPLFQLWMRSDSLEQSGDQFLRLKWLETSQQLHSFDVIRFLRRISHVLPTCTWFYFIGFTWVFCIWGGCDSDFLSMWFESMEPRSAAGHWFLIDHVCRRTYSQRRQHQAARKIQQFMRQSKNKWVRSWPLWGLDTSMPPVLLWSLLSSLCQHKLRRMSTCRVDVDGFQPVDGAFWSSNV